MKIRTIFLLFVLILMAVFLVINWTALSTVTAVNLIYTEIQAPLGVLVVGGFAAVVFVLLVYMVWQQASVTPTRRLATPAPWLTTPKRAALPKATAFCSSALKSWRPS